jgi:hypothetical protein
MNKFHTANTISNWPSSDTLLIYTLHHEVYVAVNIPYKEKSNGSKKNIRSPYCFCDRPAQRSQKTGSNPLGRTPHRLRKPTAAYAIPLLVGRKDLQFCRSVDGAQNVCREIENFDEAY